MKKVLATILISLTLLIPVTLIMVPQITLAQTTGSSGAVAGGVTTGVLQSVGTAISGISPVLGGLLNLGAPVGGAVAAKAANVVVNTAIQVAFDTIAATLLVIATIADVFVGVMGMILNASILITLNIKTLVDNVTAIGTVWVTIRNISSIFIIFMLLYASISMILGLNDHNLGETIKKIVIAGLLINFSLFFVKVAVDASNVVSLSFYSAIAPGFQTNLDTNNYIYDLFHFPGFSDIFAKMLQLPVIFQPPQVPTNDSTTQMLQNTVAQVTGIIIMVSAGFSFLAAAIMFFLRLIVLVMIMAFSPVYFVTMMFPQLKEYSDKWVKYFYSMCIVMPVYLLLMYVAIRIATDTHLVSIISSGSTTADGTATALVGPKNLATFINAFLVLFFINLPLLASIEICSKGAKFVGQWAENAKKWGQGFVGQHTLGRAAKAITDNDQFKDFVKDNPTVGLLANSRLNKIAGSTLGGLKGTSYNKRVDAYVKNSADFAKDLNVSEKEVNTSVRSGLDRYNSNLAEKLKNVRTRADAAAGVGNEADFAAAAAEEKALVAQITRGEDDDDYKKEEKDLKNKAENRKRYEYADNLKGPVFGLFQNLITKKAREEAADKIRKQANKGKLDKAFDAIKEAIPSEDKGGGDKDKKKDKEEEE